MLKGLKEESLIALRVAHLGMIQGIITRMSGFSANAKTFTITILAGLAAISLQAAATQLGVIAMIAAIPLFLIDTYYMTLEKRFRAFYDQVAGRDLDQADNLEITPLVIPGDIMKAIKAKSNGLFYGPVLIACLIFICYGFNHERKTERIPRPDTSRVEQPSDANPALAAERAEPITPTSTAKQGFGRLSR